MIGISALVDAVGPALLRVVVAGDGAEVDDLTLAELDDGVVGVPGDLVLGVGIAHPERGIHLLEQVARAGAGGVVLRAPLAGHVDVVAAAERIGVALIELRAHASWAHLVWLLRGTFDRTIGAQLDGAGVHGDLFAVADAAASILDAPVTIEDAQSRVLAYSGRQELTDPARLSTIVGRRVPEQIVAHFRAKGVFRKLARSDEPIYVGEGPEGIKPRLVIPVRAGGEWLGSIWAVVTGPVDPPRVQELTRATAVLAMHLLRLRAQTGAARRAATDLLRAVLHGAGGPTEPWLPDGPWRVAALGTPRSTATIDAKLDLWVAITRRHGWHQPLLADLDGTVVALLLDHGSPHVAGTVHWLRELITAVHPNDAELTAAIGGTATGRADLPRSRAEAAEVLRLQADGRVRAPVVGIEEVWHVVVTARARAAVRADVSLLGGPLPALVAHDRDHRTPYLETLAALLDHYGDPTAAAGALHIHPNTLRHRMHRITDVTPLNLDSAQERLALQLQLLGLQDRAPAL